MLQERRTEGNIHRSREMKLPMTDKDFLLSIASIGLASCLPSFAGEREAKGQEKPNVLIIMCDQLRSDAIGAAGKYPFLKTPNIDRLAGQGARFTNAYTPCAVSGPGRASLLTGLLVEHHGVIRNETVCADPETAGITKLPTFEQVLSDNGWYVEFQGSWDGPKMWRNCHHFIERADGFRPYMQAKYGSAPAPEGASYDPIMCAWYMPSPIDRDRYYGFDEEGNSLSPFMKMTPDFHGRLLVDEADTKTAYQASRGIEALQRVRNINNPFLITISISAPHSPLVAAERFYNMYLDEDIPIPASINDDLKGSPYEGTMLWQSPREYSNPETLRYMIANYLGLVSEVDEWVGRILEALEQTGKAANTIVVFLADHGEQLGEHGMREKNHFYEGSEKVPFIFCWPGHIKPRIVDKNTSTIDLFPTLMDYCGIDDYAQRDGRSARPVIEGKYHGRNEVVTEWLYYGRNQASHMIVKNRRWKLILNYDQESPRRPGLYNLKRDPDEMVNLIGPLSPDKEKYLRRASRLKKNMVRWLRERNSSYADRIEALDLGAEYVPYCNEDGNPI